MTAKNKSLPSFKHRAPLLSARRNLKMARSAHAYVRGSTGRFYEWLQNVQSKSLPEGPPVWICGDCHIGNLGPVANVKGRVDIQLRDFDQTVIGNPAHDLIRLGLSLASAARGSDLPGVMTAKMLEKIMIGYEEAFTEGKHSEPEAIPESVHLVLKKALKRSWKHLANERIEGSTPDIPLGKRFWPLSREERKHIHALFEAENVRELITALSERDDNATIKLVDAAFWVKGCSSLGLLRFAALVEISSKKDAELCLIDIKQASQALALHYDKPVMPKDQGERVVEGAKHLSPHLGKRMLASRLLDKPVFIRELLPQDLKVEIETLARSEAMEVAYFLAHVVGKAHARQMDDTLRDHWRKELKRNRTKSLDAPSWLWKSIVELLVSHEAAYLEHCRRWVVDRD